MIPKHPRNPLAEVFGYPINNDEPTITRHRSHQICPFNNKIPQCTKVSKTKPLGVCSMYHRGKPVITCPVRFREGWQMIADAADVFFGPGALYQALPEVRLVDRNKRKAGNVDYILVKHDDRGRILDYISLEVQAVYISGTIRGAFTTYMEGQSPDFFWDKVRDYPNPDYLSSSTKRLIPQMLVKGGIFSRWGRRQAVAVQQDFFNSLPKLQEVPAPESDLVWLIYDLVLSRDEATYKLTLVDTKYTKYKESLQQFIDVPLPDEKQFIAGLQKAVDKKRNGEPLKALTIFGEDNDAENVEEEEDDDEL